MKLPLYAEAQIQDYWLFNLPDRYLEAYSEPFQVAPDQLGYLNRRIVTSIGTIALPGLPDAVLHIDRLFP